MKNATKYIQLVYAVFALSVVLRIFIPFYFSDNWLTTDSRSYIVQANILLDGGFGLYFPNGFPALIALVTIITGTVSRDLAMILLNVVLSIASVYIYFIIIKKYFGINYFSLIALALFAFYPNQLNYVRFILTEVPSVFFLILSFYFISKNKFPAAGLMLGSATIMKTSLLVFSILFSFYLFYEKEFKHGTKFISFYFIPVLLMMVYGFIITGVFTIGYSSVHNFYLAVNQPVLLSTSLTDSVGYYLNYAFSHPLKFVLERIKSFWDFWGFLPSSNEGLRDNLIFRIIIGFRFPLLLLAIYGYFRSEKDKLVVFSSLIIVTLTVIHFVFYSIPRYNFVIELFLIFLAVLGAKKLTLRKLTN